MRFFLFVLLFRFNKNLYYPFVLRPYLYIYRYAYVLLSDRLSTLNIQ